jgi:hypothetical protein
MRAGPEIAGNKNSRKMATCTLQLQNASRENWTGGKKPGVIGASELSDMRFQFLKSQGETESHAQRYREPIECCAHKCANPAMASPGKRHTSRCCGGVCRGGHCGWFHRSEDTAARRARKPRCDRHRHEQSA